MLLHPQPAPPIRPRILTSTTDVGSLSATSTLVRPAGCAESDLLVLTLVNESGATATTTTAPAGWTSIFTTTLVTGASGSIRLHGFWSWADNTNLGFTNGANGASHQQGTMMLAIPGADPKTPIDVAGAVASSTAAATLSVTGASVLTPYALPLIGFGEWLGKVPFTAPRARCKINAGVNGPCGVLIGDDPCVGGFNPNKTITNSDGTTTAEIIAASFFAVRPSQATICRAIRARLSNTYSGVTAAFWGLGGNA